MKVVATNLNHLHKLIEANIKQFGHNVDLNYIDVSQITNMSLLFHYLPSFNGDISEWDVSNVTNMSCMFMESIFTGNINNWKVSPGTTMNRMFHDSKLEKNNNLPIWFKE